PLSASLRTAVCAAKYISNVTSPPISHAFFMDLCPTQLTRKKGATHDVCVCVGEGTCSIKACRDVGVCGCGCVCVCVVGCGVALCVCWCVCLCGAVAPNKMELDPFLCLI